MPTFESARSYFNPSCTQLNNTTPPNTDSQLEETNYEIANHWSEISAGYSQSGNQVAALEARQKAVEAYRLLDAQRPEIFEGNLARELLGLSKDLAGNGRLEEAFSASQESRMRYRHIIGQRTESTRAQKHMQSLGYVNEISRGVLETRVAALTEQTQLQGFLGLFGPSMLLKYVRDSFELLK
ncbi:unnamed protein product [Rhizoctonia solani]|uniref:Uncharacterized protein n=1 Tax=Rhizoctonia solani TaxID=456999 RepID=A0A8H3D0B7_9AGAM|nr:unnamed protein product [Rhizoctonia solani]